MRQARSILAIVAVTLMMAVAGDVAMAEHATYGPAYGPPIVQRQDLSRWFAAEKRALIDTHNAKRRQIKHAYVCGLRATRGYERKQVINTFRYELAALNQWFRGEIDSLNASYRSQLARREIRRANRPVAFGPPVTVGVDACVQAPCANGRCDARRGIACPKCDRLPASPEILGPAIDAPAPPVMDAPYPPVTPPELIPPAAPSTGEAAAYGSQPVGGTDSLFGKAIALIEYLKYRF